MRWKKTYLLYNLANHSSPHMCHDFDWPDTLKLSYVIDILYPNMSLQRQQQAVQSPCRLKQNVPPKRRNVNHCKCINPNDNRHLTVTQLTVMNNTAALQSLRCNQETTVVPKGRQGSDSLKLFLKFILNFLLFTGTKKQGMRHLYKH